jgi:transposase
VSPPLGESSNEQARSFGGFPWLIVGEDVMTVLGIDISKRDFHAAILSNDHTWKKSFPNNAKGFDQLAAWLRNREVNKIVACMEATGSYWYALAKFLFNSGHSVAVINPRRIKAFAESELLRIKTDAVDAALIARFAATQELQLWKPLAPEIEELQGLYRHLEFLKGSRIQHVTRIQTPGLPERVRTSAQTVIGQLDIQIDELERAIRDHIDQYPGLKSKHDLLTSIPGIGDTSATAILSEMPAIDEFRNAQAVAAYAGLSPLIRRSGTSVRGKPRLCKTGNARLRKALYFPAVVGQRYNPILQAFSRRLRAAGKPPMLVIGAIMRKLLVIAYGVLKSGQPFNPLYLAQGLD